MTANLNPRLIYGDLDLTDYPYAVEFGMDSEPVAGVEARKLFNTLTPQRSARPPRHGAAQPLPDLHRLHACLRRDIRRGRRAGTAHVVGRCMDDP